MSTNLQPNISLTKDYDKGSDASSLPLVDLWTRILDNLKVEFNDPNVNLWLEPLIPNQINDKTIIMSAPTRFARDSIKNKFASHILKAWQFFLPNIIALDIIVGRQKKTTTQASTQQKKLETSITEKQHQTSFDTELPLLVNVNNNKVANIIPLGDLQPVIHNHNFDDDCVSTQVQ